MSIEVRIVLALLSVYRIAELVAIDTGPYKIFERLRKWAGKKAAENYDQNTFWFNFAELINCPFCFGVWAGLFCAVLIVFPTGAGDFFLLVLGLAGAQTFLESVGSRNR